MASVPESGVGKYNFGNGDVYSGNWLNSVQNGRGKMKYSNGDRYEGLWENGQRHGEGVLHHADGDSFKGVWAHNVVVDGVYAFADSNAAWSSEGSAVLQDLPDAMVLLETPVQPRLLAEVIPSDVHSVVMSAMGLPAPFEKSGLRSNTELMTDEEETNAINVLQTAGDMYANVDGRLQAQAIDVYNTARTQISTAIRRLVRRAEQGRLDEAANAGVIRFCRMLSATPSMRLLLLLNGDAEAQAALFERLLRLMSSGHGLPGEDSLKAYLTDEPDVAVPLLNFVAACRRRIGLLKLSIEACEQVLAVCEKHAASLPSAAGSNDSTTYWWCVEPVWAWESLWIARSIDMHVSEALPTMVRVRQTLADTCGSRLPFVTWYADVVESSLYYMRALMGRQRQKRKHEASLKLAPNMATAHVDEACKVLMQVMERAADTSPEVCLASLRLATLQHSCGRMTSVDFRERVVIAMRCAVRQGNLELLALAGIMLAKAHSTTAEVRSCLLARLGQLCRAQNLPASEYAVNAAIMSHVDPALTDQAGSAAALASGVVADSDETSSLLAPLSSQQGRRGGRTGSGTSTGSTDMPPPAHKSMMTRSASSDTGNTSVSESDADPEHDAEEQSRAMARRKRPSSIMIKGTELPATAAASVNARSGKRMSLMAARDKRPEHIHSTLLLAAMVRVRHYDNKSAFDGDSRIMLHAFQSGVIHRRFAELAKKTNDHGLAADHACLALVFMDKAIMVAMGDSSAALSYGRLGTILDSLSFIRELAPCSPRTLYLLSQSFNAVLAGTASAHPGFEPQVQGMIGLFHRDLSEMSKAASWIQRALLSAEHAMIASNQSWTKVVLVPDDDVSAAASDDESDGAGETDAYGRRRGVGGGGAGGASDDALDHLDDRETTVVRTNATATNGSLRFHPSGPETGSAASASITSALSTAMSATSVSGSSAPTTPSKTPSRVDSFLGAGGFVSMAQLLPHQADVLQEKTLSLRLVLAQMHACLAGHPRGPPITTRHAKIALYVFINTLQAGLALVDNGRASTAPTTPNLGSWSQRNVAGRFIATLAAYRVPKHSSATLQRHAWRALGSTAFAFSQWLANPAAEAALLGDYSDSPTASIEILEMRQRVAEFAVFAAVPAALRSGRGGHREKLCHTLNKLLEVEYRRASGGSGSRPSSASGSTDSTTVHQHQRGSTSSSSLPSTMGSGTPATPAPSAVEATRAVAAAAGATSSPNHVIGRNSAGWTPDSEAPACNDCGRVFKATVRRHHCRTCGRVFCNRCSPKREFGGRDLRVCNACYSSKVL